MKFNQRWLVEGRGVHLELLLREKTLEELIIIYNVQQIHCTYDTCVHIITLRFNALDQI